MSQVAHEPRDRVAGVSPAGLRQLALGAPLAALLVLVAGGGNAWFVLAFLVSAAFVTASRVVSLAGPARAVDVAVTAGLALMVVGALAPWGRFTQTGASVTVEGLDRGGLLVLALAAAAALAYATGHHLMAVTAAVAALTWCALVAYQGPGALLDELGGGLAEVAWGLLLSVAGVIVVLAGAVAAQRARG